MPLVTKPDRFSSDMIVAGRVSDPHGFVTEHREIDGANGPIKVYFSVTGLRQMAARYPGIGLVPADQLDDANDAIAVLVEELSSANARIDELEASQERIAGFVKDGFKIQKVLGRPKEAH